MLNNNNENEPVPELLLVRSLRAIHSLLFGPSESFRLTVRAICNAIYGRVFDLVEMESAVGDLYRSVYPDAETVPPGALALAEIADAVEADDADAVLTDVFKWFNPHAPIPEDPMTLRAKILNRITRTAGAA